MRQTRRLRGGSDQHEVKILLVSHSERGGRRHYSDLLTVLTYDADLLGSDFLIDLQFFCANSGHLQI